MTPPWNSPFCCNSSGRRSTASVHVPRVSSDNSAPMWVMKPWRPTLSRMRDAIGAKSGSAFAFIRFLPVLARIGRDHRADCAGDQVSVWSLGSARSRPDSHARQKICAGPMIWLKNNAAVIGSNSPRSTQRRAPTLDGFRKARILRALRAADFLAPFAAGNLEQIARLAPGVHDPVQMRADQPRHAFPRAAGFVDRRQHGCVIPPEDFQEQGAGEFLLRSEEMEEAAVGRPRAGSDGRHRGALEAVAVEHRQVPPPANPRVPWSTLPAPGFRVGSLL